MTETPLAVNAVDLTKRYGRLVAVNQLSTAVTEGEVYGVLRPSRLNGPVMPTSATGQDVLNPVFAFDACYDPAG